MSQMEGLENSQSSENSLKTSDDILTKIYSKMCNMEDVIFIKSIFTYL